jgi:O-acetylhomoserine (thiol)-lyase
LSFNLLDKKACFDFLNRLQFLSIATNLMDNRTLIMHPGSTIFAEYNDEQKNQMNVPDSMIRLSVGIEEIEDILADISQALS